jgi:hypothetical protein
LHVRKSFFYNNEKSPVPQERRLPAVPGIKKTLQLDLSLGENLFAGS